MCGRVMANVDESRTGWRSTLGVTAAASLLFETLTGLAITFAPFHAAVEWSVILHTAVGVLTLLPYLGTTLSIGSDIGATPCPTSSCLDTLGSPRCSCAPFPAW